MNSKTFSAMSMHDGSMSTRAINAAISNPGTADAERIAAEIRQINDMVTALTMNIDPANLAMLNDRLTQLRIRKDALEDELRMAMDVRADHNPAALRRWARAKLTGLQAAMDGVRTDATREVIAAYVNKIVVWPSQKRGEMHLNPGVQAPMERPRPPLRAVVV